MKTIRTSVLYMFLLLLVMLFQSCNENSSKNTINNNNIHHNNENNINNVSPHLAHIEIVPSLVSLQSGQTTQLTAVGVYDDASTRDLTNEVVWVSEDESVAIVDNKGHVNALAPGVIHISAFMERITGTARIEVLPELADPVHEREFRAAWVATVWGINFPSSSSMTAQQAELLVILDALAQYGFNAVVFQVRPEGDAFYASTLEPWSRFLTGVMGQDPGWDPLEFLISEAHARNIEVHAWLNPYRALVNRNVSVPDNHVSRRFPQYAYPWGDSLLWMDPGAEDVRNHIINVVLDIVNRYDVDGIHFDDYFYPWPATGYTFPDEPLYQAYLANGGTLSKADWRRQNVDEMVRLVGEAIASTKPHVRFGVGPFGIWKSGYPPEVTGTSQYDVLYSDPKKWIEEGYVDYIAPQLYWPTTSSGQPYEPLLNWWANLSSHRYIFAGNALYQLGSNASWTVNEFRQEVQIGRNLRPRVMGNIFYHVDNILTDALGVACMLHDEFYTLPALTPPIIAVREEVPAWPNVTVMGFEVTVTHEALDTLRAWIVYKDEGGVWHIDRVIPKTESTFTLPTGRFAITAATKGNVESRAVVVSIP